MIPHPPNVCAGAAGIGAVVVMYRLGLISEGWVVIRVDGAQPDSTSGERCAGPFPHRPDAIAWVQERGQEAEREKQQRAAEQRAESFSDEGLVRALKEAIEHPPQPPRGRPASDNSREADIAFEYYWQIKIDKRNPTRAVASVAKVYRVTADHVRKVRDEFTSAAAYDDHLLTELRAQAVQRRTQPPPAKPSPQTSQSAKDAKDWLVSLFEKLGPMAADEVFQRAKLAGFSRRTIERAKQSAGIVSTRSGRTWVWTFTPAKTAI